MMVRAGNSYSNDQLRAYIEENHPNIQIVDTIWNLILKIPSGI